MPQVVYFIAVYLFLARNDVDVALLSYAAGNRSDIVRLLLTREDVDVNAKDINAIVLCCRERE